ncbi:MAG: hypothetical protein K2J38_03515 [Muribaculaceae bacterium]|nr:hypothetical protein [Muribaculaceae bacterium]
MNDLWLNIIGYSASICMILGYLPQAIVTMRTRNTDGIALPTFCMLGIGSVLFVIQGLMLGNWPLVLTNVITTVCSVIIFGMKIYNDYLKPKKK